MAWRSLGSYETTDYADASLQVPPLSISKVGKPSGRQRPEPFKISPASVMTLSILFGFKQDPSFVMDDTHGSITNSLRLFSQSRETFPDDSIKEAIRICSKLRELIIRGNMFWDGFTPLQIGEEWQVHRAFGLIWTMCTVLGVFRSSKFIKLWDEVEWIAQELNPTDREIRYVIQLWMSMRYVLWKYVVRRLFRESEWRDRLHQIMSSGLSAVCSALTESEADDSDAALDALYRYKGCPGFEKDSFLISACWGLQERRYERAFSKNPLVRRVGNHIAGFDHSDPI